MPHIALNAHLLSGQASYRSAGIHGYLYNTLTHLPVADPDFTYTVFTSHTGLPDHPQWQIEPPSFSTQQAWRRILWEQVNAPGRLRHHQPDLLHGMGFALPLMWRGPSVVTIFDLSFIRYPERLSAARRLYLQSMTRDAVRRARRVIAISESGKREIVEVLGADADRIDVAVPGVSPDYQPLPPNIVADFKQRHQLLDRFILHVGTLEPRKNLTTLIEAYARLPQRDQIRLVLVGGKGWQTEPIFALINRLNLQQDVILPGYVPDEDLPLWYNAADVFVYPSVYEGFGLPILEAMACGLPVIVSHTTSLPEAVGPDGLLVDPLDVEGWQQTLSALLDDTDLYRQQAQRGRQWAARFTWAETARQTVESYRRALA